MNVGSDWSGILPPAPTEELNEFLLGIKLRHLSYKLAELGYDDIDDFKTFNEARVAEFRAALGEALGDFGAGPWVVSRRRNKNEIFTLDL